MASLLIFCFLLKVLPTPAAHTSVEGGDGSKGEEKHKTKRCQRKMNSLLVATALLSALTAPESVQQATPSLLLLLGRAMQASRGPADGNQTEPERPALILPTAVITSSENSQREIR